MRRIWAGLHDKNVRAAHVFQNLKINFAVTELAELGFTRFGAQVAANILGQARVGAATENFKLVVGQESSFARWNRSGEIRPAQFTAVFCPRKSRAEKNLVLRKCPSSSARLRWVSEYSKHRRTATRQRGPCSSLPKQLPLDRSQSGISREDGRLKIV